jgi:hypothetical protein
MLMYLLSNQIQEKANIFSQQQIASVGITSALPIRATSNWRVKYGRPDANIRNSLVSNIS